MHFTTRTLSVLGAVTTILALAGLTPSPARAQLDTFANAAIDAVTVDYQLLTQEAGARFGAALAVGDFNSNGVDDLVIGLPGHTVNGQAGGAAVVLLDYRGTSWYAPRYYHQNITFFHDATEDGDDFGSTFAVGDFNADGYDDLAIGVPGEDLAGLADAGAVHVLYGGPGGLQTSSEVFLDRSIAPGSLEANARFGASLATGDFNLDGFDDLAIGAPLETVQGAARAGTVTIAYGSGAGLPLSGGQWWSQWQLGAVNELDTAEANDEFGRALAVGDFNHDGFDDLAVGVPRETADLSFTGALNVIYGSGSGLSAAGNLFTPQVVSRQQQSQRFGSALAAADFDGDGIDDLAVGVPYADVAVDGGVAIDAGRIAVYYGRQSLPFDLGFVHDAYYPSQGFSQPGSREYFGSQIVAGDFDGDGAADLAISAPGERVSGQADAGLVEIRSGGPRANTSAINIFSQFYLLGTPEVGDGFGLAMAVGRFTDNDDDLVVGVPFEDLAGLEDAGAVQVVFSSGPIFDDGFESGGVGRWSTSVGF